MCVGGGGASEIYPYKKGGTEKVLVMLKGGVRGGGKKFYPVLRGGETQSLELAIFPYCSPPPPRT